MRQKCFCSLAILFLILPCLVRADEKPAPAYRLLQFTLQTGNVLDLGLTTYCLSYEEAIEANPMADFYLKNRAATVIIEVFMSIVVHKLSSILYRQNKVFAYVVLGGLILLKGYAVYNNWRIFKRL